MSNLKNANKRKKNALLLKIYEAAEKQGMNPRQLLIKAGIHPNYFSLLINPSIKTLDKLATAAGGHLDFVKETI